MLKEWIETANPEILLTVGWVVGMLCGMLVAWSFMQRLLDEAHSAARLEKEFRRIDKESWESSLDRAERDVEFYTTQYRRFLSEMTNCCFSEAATRDRLIKELNEQLSKSYVDPKTLQVHDKESN